MQTARYSTKEKYSASLIVPHHLYDQTTRNLIYVLYKEAYILLNVSHTVCRFRLRKAAKLAEDALLRNRIVFHWDAFWLKNYRDF
jgi:hypothetical protein